MPPIGIQTFYYGKKLPARAIAIAQVTAEDVSPADLIDIVNTPYLPGSLGIWTLTSGLAASPNFTAPDYNQSVTITGDIVYMVQNQFFQITNQFAADGVTPLYFYHNFGQSVSGATILNLDGSVLTPAPTVSVQRQLDVPRCSFYSCLTRCVMWTAPAAFRSACCITTR